MNNKTNIEEDIKILKRIQVTEFNTDNIYDSVEKVNTAIENILADRERLKAKANKYDRLVEKIKEALDFVKTGKDADSKVKTECLENILKLIEEE